MTIADLSEDARDAVAAWLAERACEHEAHGETMMAIAVREAIADLNTTQIKDAA
jgi:hypothetical protein